MELNATFFLQLAMFLFLFAWLSQFLFAPLLQLFEEREKRIDGAAAEAKQLTASAGEAADVIEKKKAALLADVRKEQAEARAEAQTKADAIIASAREKAEDKVDDARATLFEKTEEARGALKGDVEKMADDIVLKVLGRAA